MTIITVTTTADRGVGSLRDAIRNANPGDTIKFHPSLANQTIRVTGYQLHVDKNLTIDGAGAPGLTISGNQQTRVFFVSKPAASDVNFTVRNLTVTDGYIPIDRGGAIDFRGGGALRIENVQFYNHVSRAGAVSAREGSTVTVINSKFDGNDAAQFANPASVSPTGGAISALTESKLTIKNSKFTNNTGMYGGAVGTIFSDTIIENSTFVNNSSARFGGGLYVDGASWPSESKYLPTGVAPKDVPGGQVVIRNSRFQGNRGVAFGGGIAIWGYDKDFVTVEGSTITGNQVTKATDGVARGGGMWSSGVITMKNTIVSNNRSQVEGGGLYYQGGTPVTITNSSFLGNQARGADGRGFGGAIYDGQWGSKTTIAQSTFKYNQAATGGAIYKQRTSVPLTITDSAFSGNSLNRFNDSANITIGQTSTAAQIGSTPTSSAQDQVVQQDSNDPSTNQTEDSKETPPVLGGTVSHHSNGGTSGVDATVTDGGDGATSTPTNWNPDVNQSNSVEAVAIAADLMTSSVNGSTSNDSNAIDVDLGTDNILVTASDKATTKAKSAVEIDVLANDSTTADFSLTLVNKPRYGRVRIRDNGTPENLTDDVVLYTPKGNFIGRDRFTYQINNGTGEVDSARVNISITPTKRALAAKAKAQRPAELIDLTGIDLDSNGQVDTKVTATFSNTRSEAGHNNSAGLYQVETKSGAVRDPMSGKFIQPGETGYGKAALEQRLSDVELHRYSDLVTTQLEAGTLLAPYLIVNGTSEQFLAQETSNQRDDDLDAYFAYRGANSDKTDHVRLLGENHFAFADKRGGGDKDFHDFAFKVNLKTV
jgi:hypothetical protein